MQVKVRFKSFYWLLELLYTASPWTPPPEWLVLLEHFAYPCYKREIHRPELNLWNLWIPKFLFSRSFLELLIYLSSLSSLQFFLVGLIKDDNFKWMCDLKWLCRRSRLDVFYKKVFWKISQNSQENTCVRVSFQIKVQAWGCDFVKSVNFVKFLRRPFLLNTSGGCFCLYYYTWFIFAGYVFSAIHPLYFNAFRCYT